MVGLGVDIGDIADYVAPQRPRHRRAAAGARRARLRADGSCSASSMVVYGEGRYRCPEHGDRAPGAAAAVRPRRRALRAAVPGLRPRARRASRPRGRAGRPAQRLRRDQARPGAPVRGVRARDRRRRAPRCATTTSTARGCRATRRTPAWRASSAPRSPPAGRRGCSRTAASGATSSTCATSRAPTCSRSPRPVAGRVQRRQRHAAHGARHGPRARPRRRAGRRSRWSPASGAAGDVRHVVRLGRARAAERLGFRASEDFDAGDARVRRRAAARVSG